MQAWRQLTDLICWVPVTCCRTFSSSFSMRPAQWIILENKIRHFQSASLDIITCACHHHSFLLSLDVSVFCNTVSERVSANLWVSRFLFPGPYLDISLSYLLLISGLVTSSFPHHHILHISGRPWQDWRRTCLSWLGLDQRLCNKTAQVWQKCTLSRSWSPLDGAKFGIKRSNGSSSSLYISQQATNDLMDQDFH